MKASVRRLKAVVESDPGSLARVLHLFQARNVTPVRVAARRLGPEFLEIEIDVAGEDLSTDAMQLLSTKVREMTIAICAVACD